MVSEALLHCKLVTPFKNWLITLIQHRDIYYISVDPGCVSYLQQTWLRNWGTTLPLNNDNPSIYLDNTLGCSATYKWVRFHHSCKGPISQLMEQKSHSYANRFKPRLHPQVLFTNLGKNPMKSPYFCLENHHSTTIKP